MKRIIILLFFAFLIPATGFAQDRHNYLCTMGDLTRRVEVFSEPGVAVPCEVHYYKDSEAPGERQVLWRALNEAGYCQTQAAAFVATLGGIGWNCGASAAAPTEEPVDDVVEADDTADLAPAEEIEPPDPD
jgi:hypothetical protein